MRVGKIVVVIALVAMTGAHWAFLQSLAWTTMLANNLRTHSVTESISQTFDGAHPCPLCKAITAGKKSEQKNDFTVQIQKMEFPPVADTMILTAPSYFHPFSPIDCFAGSFSPEPSVPPPRLA